MILLKSKVLYIALKKNNSKYELKINVQAKYNVQLNLLSIYLRL